MQWIFDASKIKLARSSRDKTQGELAADIGATPQQLSQWEKGKHTPSVGSLIKICNALDCPPKFFFTANGDDCNQQEE